MTRCLRRLGCAGLLAWLSVLAAEPAATQPAPEAPAPDLEELRGATFRGIEGPGEVTLAEGVWEGAPFVAGGATRPTVSLVQGFRRVGDLDGDGVPEAVVLLAARGGGTGENLHLAVAKREGERIVNVATALVGDRVQVRDARIEEGRIVLDVVQVGPGDAMCCPGELLSRSWELRGSSLEELPASASAGRLSPEGLAGEEWVLRAWNVGEEAPAEPEVTLVYAEGRFAGSSGCNRYSAAVTAGETPGDLALGPAIGTRMACPPRIMDVESRFLAQLVGVRKLGFLGGRLALTHEKDGAAGTMLFARRGEDAEGDEAALDPEAIAIAMRMAERLSGAERLSVRVDASYDAIQYDGQVVEFGGIREVTLQRPDRLRVSGTDRSPGRRLLVYDGRTLSFWNEGHAVYAQTPRTGSLDDVFDYLVDDLGVKLPLAELFSAELPRLFEEDVLEASLVGVETLGGVECDHLVFRNEDVGFQIWVERNGEPVPRRVVIVYEQDEGRPQFRADLSEWNLSPRTPGSLFAFRPPKGAERVSFLPRRRDAAEEVR
jgi:hypothetical protein